MLRSLGSLLCIVTAASAAAAALATPSPHAAKSASAAQSASAAVSASDAMLGGDAGTVEAAVPGPLPFLYDLFTFRGDARSTVVVAAFAVHAGRLETEESERDVRYRFDVTLVLADTALRSVSRTDDSVFVGARRPLPGEHLLFTHIEVQARPSATTLQRVIMTDATTPGVGQLYSSPFPIPDYSGDHLMLSDIALGQPGAQAGWQRGDVTLALLPTGEFPGSSFDVFYEIYNLPPGHRYTTRITVRAARTPDDERAADEGEVGLRLAGAAPAGSNGLIRELKRVDSSLGRGRYRITVVVTDEETGASASRTRTFQVREDGQGATLVAALPRTNERLRSPIR
jgi:hypothetical protein